jgi:chitin-binding protein
MTSVLRAFGARFRELPTPSRQALIAAGVVLPATLIMLVGFSLFDSASAHGSLEAPPSRIYYCRFFDSPENPANPACRAAIAESGTQAVYDWNEVNQPNAGGNHRAVVPDGQLCSGGRTKYRGFDLARPDWPATPMTAGGWYEFRLLGSAAHVGTVELYLTRDGYDPTRPLRWSDLEATPFLTVTGTSYPANYTATARLPGGKTGRHLIYMIWQRSDSPEAFYACSDVDFGGGGVGGGNGSIEPVPHDHGATTPVDTGTPSASPTATSPTTSPTTTGAHEHHQEHHHEPATHQPGPTTATTTTASGSPSGAGAPTAPAWTPGTTYAVGALVTHNGRVYRCVQAHTSQVGWEPATTPALWVGVVDTSGGQTPVWQPNTGYPTGQVVSYNGRLYRCRQGHTSLPGWEPPNTPALWELVA